MLVLISYPTFIKEEVNILKSLCKKGLEEFQIYKPGFSPSEIHQYIKTLPPEIVSKTTWHQDMLKFHSIKEVEDCKIEFNRAFISPVFNSISKKGYESLYDLPTLASFVKSTKRPLYALGGIDETNISIIKKMGFSGCGILGAIWKHKDPINNFIKIKNQWLA